MLSNDNSLCGILLVRFVPFFSLATCLASTALSSSAPPAAGRQEQNDQLAAVVASSAARRPAAARSLPPHVPHPASGNAGVRLRASARRRAQPSAAPGPHCHPRREPVPASMPAYDYLRKTPASRLRSGPDVHRVRGGQVCGAGATLWRDRGGGSGWSQGMPDLPLVVSLEFYVCISTAFR